MPTREHKLTPHGEKCIMLGIARNYPSDTVKVCNVRPAGSCAIRTCRRTQKTHNSEGMATSAWGLGGGRLLPSRRHITSVEWSYNQSCHHWDRSRRGSLHSRQKTSRRRENRRDMPLHCVNVEATFTGNQQPVFSARARNGGSANSGGRGGTALHGTLENEEEMGWHAGDLMAM